MIRSPESFCREWRQYAALAFLSLGSAGATAVAEITGGREFFRPYFGNFDPPAVVGLTIVVGSVCLPFLRRRGWFDIYERRKALKGAAISAVLATLLAVPVIAVDFAAGIRAANVPPPWSFSFYPAIAFVVEVIFHALPLALLAALVGCFVKKPSPRGLVWACILLV